MQYICSKNTLLWIYLLFLPLGIYIEWPISPELLIWLLSPSFGGFSFFRISAASNGNNTFTFIVEVLFLCIRSISISANMPDS